MSDSVSNPAGDGASSPMGDLAQAAIERSKNWNSGRPGGPRRRIPQSAQMELALAWLKGDATQAAITAVVGIPPGNGIYTLLALGLRTAYQRGLLKL